MLSVSISLQFTELLARPSESHSCCSVCSCEPCSLDGNRWWTISEIYNWTLAFNIRCPHAYRQLKITKRCCNASGVHNSIVAPFESLSCLRHRVMWTTNVQQISTQRQKVRQRGQCLDRETSPQSSDIAATWAHDVVVRRSTLTYTKHDTHIYSSQYSFSPCAQY